MKYVSVVARIALGLLFLVSALNSVLHFIVEPTAPNLGGPFMMLLAQSHYLPFIYLLQFVAAVLLLVNRFVPLALVVLAPIIINILVFHLLISRVGAGLPVAVVLFWCTAAFGVRSAFASLLQQKVSSVTV